MTNIENILYPDEALDEYKKKLLEVYLEDYGEEYKDIIIKRMNNTLYLFDSNPKDTLRFILNNDSIKDFKLGYANNDSCLYKHLILQGYSEDVILASNIKSESSLKDYFELITYTVLPSIASNILYTYMILNYRNSKSIIWYRIITTIYRYIIPIIPDIHVLFESIIRMVTPFIIYQILVLLYEKKEKPGGSDRVSRLK